MIDMVFLQLPYDQQYSIGNLQSVFNALLSYTPRYGDIVPPLEVLLFLTSRVPN